MSLQTEIDQLNSQLRQQLPPETLKLVEDAMAGIVETGVEKTALDVGTRAPDFTLPNAVGGQVSLAGLRRRGPVVLSFYRGNW